ncbi:MAG: transposase [Chloroflexi bacterium]|nr:transposase [Chloroflexota bacterium]
MGTPSALCPDFEKGNHCKHLYAVEYVVQRETKPDGTTIDTQAMRVTYAQEWPAYNQAQTHEQDRFIELLGELCKGIVQPEHKGAGRPSHPLSAVVMASALKVYSTVSGRRAMTDLRQLVTKGYLAKAPSYNSIFDYLENPELTPLLKTLIEETAQPLKGIETDFAVDSSGFTTCVYDRWYDEKYGKMKSENKWVKVHLMTGVKTHVVTSVEATPFESADAPQFPALVNQTAKKFTINEVSADKAYSAKKNLRVVASVGAISYIPFKSQSKGTHGHHEPDNLWNKMWHFYEFNKAVFYEHYHKRLERRNHVQHD